MEQQLTQGQQLDIQAATIRSLQAKVVEQSDQLDMADRKVDTLTRQLEACTSNSHKWEQNAKSAEYALDFAKELIKEKMT